MRLLRLALLAVCISFAGCGSSAPHTVCKVSPGPNNTLIYSPAGCQNHLKGETLDIQP